VALSLGPNITSRSRRSGPRRPASSAIEVERALIEALARRYSSLPASTAMERSALERAYYYSRTSTSTERAGLYLCEQAKRHDRSPAHRNPRRFREARL
jgi:hypothetical protein